MKKFNIDQMRLMLLLGVILLAVTVCRYFFLKS